MFESKWFERCRNRIVAALSPDTRAGIAARMSGNDDDAGEVLFGAATAFACACHLTPRGTTVLDEWELETKGNLSADDRILFSTWRTVRPALIEIQRKRDTQSLECTDLLDPARPAFVLLDRSLASTVQRFDRLLMWLWHLPHFTRPACGGVRISHEVFDIVKETISMTARLPFGPKLVPYIASNFGAVQDLVAAATLDLRTRMLESLDMVQIVARYRLLCTCGEVKAVLDSKPDFVVDDETDQALATGVLTYDWLRKGESKGFEETTPSSMRHDEDSGITGILGKVRLLADAVEVETVGRQKAEFAKDMIERFLHGKIAPVATYENDLAKTMAEREKRGELPDDDPQETDDDAIPPEIRQHVIEQYYREHYRKFLDDHIPALDGMTPRDAARHPTRRAKLVALIKDHINSIEQMRQTQ